jgi:hypothetical protein
VGRAEVTAGNLENQTDEAIARIQRRVRDYNASVGRGASPVARGVAAGQVQQEVDRLGRIQERISRNRPDATALAAEMETELETLTVEQRRGLQPRVQREAERLRRAEQRLIVLDDVLVGAEAVGRDMASTAQRGALVANEMPSRAELAAALDVSYRGPDRGSHGGGSSPPPPPQTGGAPPPPGGTPPPSQGPPPHNSGTQPSSAPHPDTPPASTARHAAQDAAGAVAGAPAGRSLLRRAAGRLASVIPFVGIGLGLRSARSEFQQGNYVRGGMDLIGTFGGPAGELFDAVRAFIELGPAPNGALGVPNSFVIK